MTHHLPPDRKRNNPANLAVRDTHKIKPQAE